MQTKSNNQTNNQLLVRLLAATICICLTSCASTGYFNPKPVISYCPSNGVSLSCKFGN